jgi:hypothetical protein
MGCRQEEKVVTRVGPGTEEWEGVKLRIGPAIDHLEKKMDKSC